MFIANVHGKEAINSLAQSLGCKAGLCGTGWGAKPGVIGNTYSIKDQLKAAGARWNSSNSAWAFESWADLEAALKSVTA